MPGFCLPLSPCIAPLFLWARLNSLCPKSCSNHTYKHTLLFSCVRHSLFIFTQQFVILFFSNQHSRGRKQIIITAIERLSRKHKGTETMHQRCNRSPCHRCLTPACMSGTAASHTILRHHHRQPHRDRGTPAVRVTSYPPAVDCFLKNTVNSFRSWTLQIFVVKLSHAGFAAAFVRIFFFIYFSALEYHVVSIKLIFQLSVIRLRASPRSITNFYVGVVWTQSLGRGKVSVSLNGDFRETKVYKERFSFEINCFL